MLNKISNLYFPYKKISKAIRSFRFEVSKNNNAVKGEAFEDYVRKFIFPKNEFDLLHKTHDYNKEDFIKNSLLPDFVFECKNGNSRYRFAVEAKFRSKTPNGDYPLNICGEGQLYRYRDFGRNNKLDVFIILGLEGTCYNPKNLYLIPVLYHTSHSIQVNDLNENHKITPKQVVATSYLDFLKEKNIKLQESF